MTSRALKQSYFLLFGLSDTSSTELLKSNGRFLWSNLQAAFRWSIQSDLIQIVIIPWRLSHVTIHLVKTYVQRPPADKDINSTLLMLIWMMVFAAQCKAFATGVTTHHIWPNLQTVRLRVQKYLCFLFPKVRSPSSGSLQKLHSCNRCPELRTWTWKQTKHAHYSFHRNLRGDRIGNQNTLKVSFYLPPDSKQSLLYINSLKLPKIFIDGSFWGAWAKSHPSSLLTLAVASEVICN